MSPFVRDVIAGVVQGVGNAAAGALRAEDDADALRVLRASLLEQAESIESALAREKFPELREG